MRQDSAPLPPSRHLVPLSLQFLLIFRKAAAGELQEDSGLHVLARLSEIDVSTEGVKGAKSFFEAKVRSQLPCGPSSRTGTRISSRVHSPPSCPCSGCKDTDFWPLTPAIIVTCPFPTCLGSGVWWGDCVLSERGQGPPSLTHPGPQDWALRRGSLESAAGSTAWGAPGPTCTLAPPSNTC